eukprot:Transcript_25810.p2 GENE.Transcript_25810~~Transcript_25810.p2  ORF type:complete len:333 (-),score=47.98 Transcript_25810:211-1209(-)
MSCTPSTSAAASAGVLSAPVFFAGEEMEQILRAKAPYGYRGEALSKISRFMANATQPTQRRFASCAVVGASGALKSHRWGPEIDSHSAVFRANPAPVGGKWAPWTGRRSTWRVFSSAYWKGHYAHSGPNEQFLVVCNSPWVNSCQFFLFERHDLFPRAHAVNPAFYDQTRRQLGLPPKLIPTVGLLAVAAAIHACDRVRVYGFGNGSRTSCYYYYKARAISPDLAPRRCAPQTRGHAAAPRAICRAPRAPRRAPARRIATRRTTTTCTAPSRTITLPRSERRSGGGTRPGSSRGASRPLRPLQTRRPAQSVAAAAPPRRSPTRARPRRPTTY